MQKITITEALSEVKLIDKKLAKKKTFVFSNLYRFDAEADPLEKEGGSEQVLKSECQSIKDLNARRLRIRRAIASANLNNEITIGEQTKSIFDWLTWKREVAKTETEFYAGVHSRIKAKIDEARLRPPAKKDEDGEWKIGKLVTNLDYSEFFRLDEKNNDLSEQLDGKLSLKNATITVDI